MRILIACEESQVVTKAFRAKGHEAFSCDILPTSGANPEWHLQKDVLEILNQSWDMILAFPMCTDLCVSGAKWFAQKQKDGRQQKAIDFFMTFANHPCKKVCIENPVGIMSSVWRKPDQIIQPWQFGHEATKTTCLWLKGLPLLVPTQIVSKGTRHITSGGKSLPAWYNLPPSEDRAKIRSKTFEGIGIAMSEQWG